jgi:outer membrane protein OmpA-like peptidoglycan-associated protein
MAAEHARLAVVCLALLWALVPGPGTAWAQGPASVAPDTRDIIEALKPVRQRNLLVRPAAVASAPAAAPAPTLAPVATLPAASQPQAPAVSAPLAPTAPHAAAPNPAAPTAPATTPSPSPSPSPQAAATEAAPSLSLAIQFDLNSARVRPESGAVLGNLVAAMLSAELRHNRFLIEGHTDARGNPGANKLLSQHRADEVRLYLVALGVHPSRLKAVGKGSSEPANPRDPLAGDNRRVRVVTLE